MQTDDALYLALAHPARRAVLEHLLQHGAAGAGALVQASGMSASALSQHLAVLLQAGLVTRTRIGRQQVYDLNPEPLLALAHWVQSFEAAWQNRLNRLGDFLDRIYETPPVAALPQEGKAGHATPSTLPSQPPVTQPHETELPT